MESFSAPFPKQLKTIQIWLKNIWAVLCQPLIIILLPLIQLYSVMVVLFTSLLVYAAQWSCQPILGLMPPTLVNLSGP